MYWLQSAAFTLGLEDTLAHVYFSKKEKQRDEHIKLIGEVQKLFSFFV